MTSTAVLNGLDPERFHDYEIVAYTQESLESGPANARVTTKEECNLGVRVFSAQNSTGYSENKHTSIITGCQGKNYDPQAEYPKLSWINGSGSEGVADSEGVITFSDGEKAQTSPTNNVFFRKNGVLAINPSTS